MYDRVDCEPLLSVVVVEVFSLRLFDDADDDDVDDVNDEDDGGDVAAAAWLFVAKQTFCTALESNNRRRPVQSHSRNNTTRTCSLENGNMQLKKKNKKFKKRFH